MGRELYSCSTRLEYVFIAVVQTELQRSNKRVAIGSDLSPKPHAPSKLLLWIKQQVFLSLLQSTGVALAVVLLCAWLDVIKSSQWTH